MDAREQILKALEELSDEKLEEINKVVQEQAVRLFLAMILASSLDTKES